MVSSHPILENSGGERVPCFRALPGMAGQSDVFKYIFRYRSAAGAPLGGGGIFHSWLYAGLNPHHQFMERPIFIGTPVPESDLTKKQAVCYRQTEHLSPSKNSSGNSGTPEPAACLVVPLFPQSPDLRGHNSEICGTGPE